MASGIGAHLDRPSGWFQIGWSREFPVGAVHPLRYFARKLVCWRAASGRLTVADAHCPHMGAHLGHGGTVHGEDLVCPFHGWHWSPEGHNTEIPYSAATSRQGLGTWPVRERSGVVYLWHDPDGREPYYEPPHIVEADNEGWYQAWPSGVHTVRDGRLFPQYVLENAVDLAHLKYVHGWDEVPVEESVDEGDAWFRSSFSGELVTRSGRAPIRNTTEAWGVSCMLSRLEGLRETVQLMCTTPVDDMTSDVRFSVFVRREPHDPPGETPGLVRAIVKAQTTGEWDKDAVIWEHMEYVEKAPVVREEARAVVAMRRWSRRFYPQVTAR